MYELSVNKTNTNKFQIDNVNFVRCMVCSTENKEWLLCGHRGCVDTDSILFVKSIVLVW